MIKFANLKGNFTKIPNQLLNDPKLSWKAKGLFCHMASKPDNYNFTVKSLANQFSDGKSAVFAALTELKDRGWISYLKSTNGSGEYNLKTSINHAFTTKSPTKSDLKPKSDNPDLGFPKFGKSESINKKDLLNNKDIYKGDFENERSVYIEASVGDYSGSSTKYTSEQILQLAKMGVIDVH